MENRDKNIKAQRNKPVNKKKPSENKKNGSVSQAAIRKALTIAVMIFALVLIISILLSQRIC